jgi:hypothetical protein
LDETNLDESVGIVAGPESAGLWTIYGHYAYGLVPVFLSEGSNPINWDQDVNTNENPTAWNINFFNISGCANEDGGLANLLGYNDWAGINLDMKGGEFFADGIKALNPLNSSDPDDDRSAVEISDVAAGNGENPPTADAGDYTGNEGDTIILTSEASYDDGTIVESIEDIETILWDIGGPDGVANGVFDEPEDARGVTTPIFFEDDESESEPGIGVFFVSLALWDDDDNGDTDTASITIYNVAPIVDTGDDITIDENDTITDYIASFSDPGILDVGNTATIDWGDGSTVVNCTNADCLSETAGTGPGIDDVPPRIDTSGTVTGTHQYLDDDDDGMYTLTVTVTDKDGGIGTDTLTVNVNNVDPEILSGGGSTGDVNEGAPMSFNDVAFTDVGTLDTHTAYVDYESDGTTDQTIIITPGTYSVSIPDNTYSTSGTFTVTVTIEDDDLGSDSIAFDVTVLNIPPEIQLDPIPGTTSPITYGDTIYITGTIDDSSDSFTISVDWTGSSLETGIISGSDISISHEYTESPSGDLSVWIEVCEAEDPLSCATFGPVTIDIDYKFGGYQSPVPEALYELGRTIPVKVAVWDVYDQPVTNAVVEVFWVDSSGNEYPGEANNSRLGNVATLKQGVYQFNMITDDLSYGPIDGQIPLGQITILVKLDDGTEYPQIIEIK